MVGVAPHDVLAVDAALGEHCLGLFVEAVALPGFGREHADVLEDAHRRHAVDKHLARLATRGEGEELVTTAGGGVGFGRGQQILLGEVAALHDILQRFGGKRCAGAQAQAGCDEQGRGLYCQCFHFWVLPRKLRNQATFTLMAVQATASFSSPGGCSECRSGLSAVCLSICPKNPPRPLDARTQIDGMETLSAAWIFRSLILVKCTGSKTSDPRAIGM